MQEKDLLENTNCSRLLRHMTNVHCRTTESYQRRSQIRVAGPWIHIRFESATLIPTSRGSQDLASLASWMFVGTSHTREDDSDTRINACDGTSESLLNLVSLRLFKVESDQLKLERMVRSSWDVLTQRIHHIDEASQSIQHHRR